jgi:hypothetical protein
MKLLTLHEKKYSRLNSNKRFYSQGATFKSFGFLQEKLLLKKAFIKINF